MESSLEMDTMNTNKKGTKDAMVNPQKNRWIKAGPMRFIMFISSLCLLSRS